MGGAVEASQMNNFSWELPLSQLQYELSSNVVTIGNIKTGIHCHRALLFKVSLSIVFFSNIQRFYKISM